MRIVTKNLILVPFGDPNEILIKRWHIFKKKTKHKDEPGIEIARFYFSFLDDGPAKSVLLDIQVVNKENFEILGKESISSILSKYLFRKKDIYYVRCDVDDGSELLIDNLKNAGFVQKKETGSWTAERPAPHYTLFFMMLGGMCGLSFGRSFPNPFLIVIAGFVLGFLIGFPLDKKDKVIRK